MFGGGDRGLEKRLRKGAGKAARAVIVDARKGHWESSTGGSPAELVNSARVTWELVLRVMPEGGPPFDATVREAFRAGGRPTLDDQIKVLYDPQDHGKVVIDHTPMTDAERMDRRRRAVEKAVAEGHAPAASPFGKAPAPGSDPGVNVADELGKLAALRDRGVLTELEFQTQKRKILDL
jgi:Short C-terminal domain